MASTDALVTGGGIGGLALAVVYVGRLTLDWLRERRTAPTETATAAVTDAATANAALVSSLQLLQAENTRLHARVAQLEDEDRKKDEKITVLEAQIAHIATELAALRSTNRKGGIRVPD
jgi:predicted  nucleic acid-binding Zn-ribbon protein